MSQDKKLLDPSFVQRVAQGFRYAVSGKKPAEWFGPSEPLEPVAQESTEGRRFDYPVATNTSLQPKGSSDSAVSFSQLRALADNLDILRLVIESRKDRISAIAWDIVDVDGKKSSEKVIAQVRSIFASPSADYNWSGWLRAILEDLFVLDAVAVYPRKTRSGEVVGFDLIDGSLIKRLVTADGRTPVAPLPAYQQAMKGMPTANYTTDELIYRMRNARTHKLYGYSPVEQILMTINIALRRQLTQLQHYTEGNVPEALASSPETWNVEQIKQFQLYFDAMLSGNSATRSRLKFIPTDVSKIKEMRDPALKDTYDEWLARIVCYAFSVPPSPFVREMNRATAESAARIAAEEGLQPIMNWVENLVNELIQKVLLQDSVKFQWVSKPSVDSAVQAQIDKIYIETGVRTSAGVAAERGWAVVRPAVQDGILP